MALESSTYDLEKPALDVIPAPESRLLLHQGRPSASSPARSFRCSNSIPRQDGPPDSSRGPARSAGRACWNAFMRVVSNHCDLDRVFTRLAHLIDSAISNANGNRALPDYEPHACPVRGRWASCRPYGLYWNRHHGPWGSGAIPVHAAGDLPSGSESGTRQPRLPARSEKPGSSSPKSRRTGRTDAGKIRSSARA